MHCAKISEHELHAFVDRQLANERQRDVTAYLAAHPAAAQRVAVFARQRAALAALAQCVAHTGAGAPATELEQALCRAIRRQARLRGHRGRRHNNPTGGRSHGPAAFGAVAAAAARQRLAS